MLVYFSVENFKSIRDLQTLSMEAEKGDHKEWSNLIDLGSKRLIKTLGIYGPNASGKSNVLEAMKWFRWFTVNSSRAGQSGDETGVIPFLLNTGSAKEPTHFEIEFLIEGIEYRYGYALDNEHVVEEWLFRRKPGAKEAKLFTREEQEFTLSATNFKEGKGLEERTRKEALFLSVCAQFNGTEAVKIMKWMQRFRFVSGLSEAGFFSFTAKQLDDDDARRELIEFAKKADFNIQDIESQFEEITPDILPSSLPDHVREEILKEGIQRPDIKTKHHRRNEKGEIVGTVEFDLKSDESEGTQKFIALSGPILHTLEEGSILVVDELEARLHPLLTQAIVDLFHSVANRNNAQMVFATHDVTLMDPDRFRREQIWFCEKGEDGATNLYSLADFDSSKVRPTSKFARQYLSGSYGAVPKTHHLQSVALDATAQK